MFTTTYVSLHFRHAGDMLEEVENTKLKSLNVLLINRYIRGSLDVIDIIDSQHPGVTCFISDFGCGCAHSFHRHGDITHH